MQKAIPTQMKMDKIVQMAAKWQQQSLGVIFKWNTIHLIADLDFQER